MVDVNRLKTVNGGFTERTIWIMQQYTRRHDWTNGLKKIPEEDFNYLVAKCKRGEEWKYDTSRTKTIKRSDLTVFKNMKGNFSTEVVQFFQAYTGEARWLKAIEGWKVSPDEWENIIDKLVKRKTYYFDKEGYEGGDIPVKLSEVQYRKYLIWSKERELFKEFLV